jgi:hypothetical protein
VSSMHGEGMQSSDVVTNGDIGPEACGCAVQNGCDVSCSGLRSGASFTFGMQAPVLAQILAVRAVSTPRG